MKLIHLIRCNILYVASDQMWRIMKLIIVIMTVFLVQVSASTSAQQITIKDSNISLREVIAQIRKQTGFTVFAQSSLINKAKPLNLNLSAVPLKDALELITKGQNLDYSIEEKAIVISEKKEPSFLDRVIDRFDNIDVRGRVVDAQGNGVAGATVQVKDGKRGTTTDQQGYFELKNVDDKAVIVASSVGYMSKEFSAKADLGIVKLELSDSKLDEVKVIAYGTTTERLSTGNVSTIKAADIEKQPVSNILKALQGRIPGLVINQESGIPGSGFSSFQLRGTNSISGDVRPLIIVDGVPIAPDLPQSPLGYSLGSGNPLNYIDINSIESVSVLKDADATAIYGSRAANGAILITTKKGTIGKTALDLDVNSGFSTTAHDIQWLNTEQYLQMRREAFFNDSLASPGADIKPGPADHDLNGDWDINRYTNWTKELIKNPAPYLNSRLSISGGSPNITYLIGGSYNREKSPFPVLLPGQGVNQSGAVNFSLNGFSNDQKFKVLLKGGYLSSTNKMQTVDLSTARYRLAPNAPSIYNSDGTLNWGATQPGGFGTWANPYAPLLMPLKQRADNLTSNLKIDYELFSGFQASLSLGYTKQSGDNYSAEPKSTQDPAWGVTTSSATFQNTNSTSLIVEPQLNYHTRLGQGEFSALLGGTINDMKNKGLTQFASGFITDALLQNVSAAPSVTYAASDQQYKYNAVFGRIGYNWKSKYILNGTIRRDGSSRFGPGKQFGNFYSIAGAWVFSEEEFLKNNLQFLSFGKIRSSYGVTGNDGIGNYRYLDLYNIVGSPTYQGFPYLVPGGLYNPDYQWETNKKFEIGLDLGFANDRILVQSSYYKNRSGNQLTILPMPSITGFGSVTGNSPALIQNSGFEFVLSTTNLKSKSFTWMSSLNIGINRNKLLAFQGLEQSPYAGKLFIGEPVTIRKSYRYAGVNEDTGLYQFYDKAGKTVPLPTYLDDAVVFTDLAPKFTGGFQNTIQYKSFSLDVFFQFSRQKGQSIFSAISQQPGTMYNQPIDVLNRWQRKGDGGVEYQKFTQNYSGYSNESFALESDHGYVDASYIRLKTLSLSWQAPDHWKRVLRLRKLGLNIQAQNVFTITSYPGIDPETQGLSLPPMKVWTMGLQLGI